MNEDRVRGLIAESRARGAAQIVGQSFVPTKVELLDYVSLAKRGNAHGREFVVHGMSRLVFDRSCEFMLMWASQLPDHASFDDVFAGGLVGLQLAVDRFDLESGNAFTSYAVWYIRSEIQRVIYDLAGGGAIRAKTFLRVSSSDGMSGVSVRSLDEEVDDAGGRIARGELVEGDSGADAGPMDIALVCELFDLLSAIDPAMPEVARLLDVGYTEREIAKLTGMKFARVRELRAKAQRALEEEISIP